MGIVTDPANVVEIRDVLCNRVAAASQAHQLRLGQLRTTLIDALGQGADLGKLATAAGMSCEDVANLVNQGQL